MRVFMIAFGLCVAATAASAAAKYETVSRTDTNLTLTNGCVYTPNQFAQNNTWSFAHSETGADKTCPLMVRLQIYSVQFEPSYLVGVYR